MLRHIPTYHVRQACRAKRPKTVVSHDLESPSQPLKNEFAEGCRKSDSILKLKHFLKPCVLFDYIEKKKTMLSEVIWSLGANSKLTQFYFKVDQILNYLLLSWRISDDRLHIQLRDSQKSDINILRLTFKVCYLMCTSWSLVYQTSNFQFSAFFRILFTLWSLKYLHPKSQQTHVSTELEMVVKENPVSTELEMVVNLSYSFIPLQKILQEKSFAQLKIRGRALKISKWRRTRRTNFTGACADEMPPPSWATLNYRALIWGANKLTGKMVLILQQEEWISLLVMVLFSTMFSYFILDSFELEEMVCLTKHVATFSSLKFSWRTYCSSYDEHACDAIIFS